MTIFCLIFSYIEKAMRFGDLPPWAIELGDSVREAVVLGEEATGSLPFPTDVLSREPLFDQLIANRYQPGEGICAHVDLMRFEDGIAIVSLESPCVMHFSRATQESCDEEEKVAVYLSPGSLVLLSGDARYAWKHEINRKPGFQIWQGQELDQFQRTSITLRRLCPS
ncbi:Alkylated DNA repair protein ALKBH8 homolog [Linum grandiflorum]